MFCLNHKVIINGKLAGEVNLIFMNLHSAQSRMQKKFGNSTGGALGFSCRRENVSLYSG